MQCNAGHTQCVAKNWIAKHAFALIHLSKLRLYPFQLHMCLFKWQMCWMIGWRLKTKQIFANKRCSEAKICKNKTIKDGDIAPWKDFKKEKRKRNYSLVHLVWQNTEELISRPFAGHSVLIQLATYTFFNFQNLTSGTVLLFFFGLICDIGATRIFLFCRFDLYWACVSPFLAPFCPQNRLFLRYTHITPIFWGQTVPTQWDHKSPTSWGNSG